MSHAESESVSVASVEPPSPPKLRILQSPFACCRGARVCQAYGGPAESTREKGGAAVENELARGRTMTSPELGAEV